MGGETNKRSTAETSTEESNILTPVKKAKLDDEQGVNKASPETKSTEEKEERARGLESKEDSEELGKGGDTKQKKILEEEQEEEQKVSEEDLGKTAAKEGSENTEDKKLSDEQDHKSESSGAKPKFTFGQSSSFSSGFGVASKPFGSSSPFGGGFSVAKSDTAEKKDVDSSKSGFSFGAGLSFGAGFNTAKTETKSKTEISAGAEETLAPESKDETPAVPPEPTVKLTKQEVKSGEETEESLFQTNAKLYQLSSIQEGWKERGLGVLHLNKDKGSGKSRVVMRSRGLLKVILNLPLVKGFSIQKGFPGSLHGEKFVRIIAVDENKKPVQYAIKTGKAEIADELRDKVLELVSESQ